MRYVLLIFIAITCTIACKKDDSGIIFSLPAKTYTGQNTFGFMLDNLVWTNYGRVCFPFAGGCRDNLKGYYYNDGDLTINADRVLHKGGIWNTSESVSIYLKTKFKGTITYSTLTNDNIGVYYSYSEIHKKNKVYVAASINPNFIVSLTKIDSTNRIISGEFSGVLFNKSQDTTNTISKTDSIIIREGRFDIKMK